MKSVKTWSLCKENYCSKTTEQTAVLHPSVINTFHYISLMHQVTELNALGNMWKGHWCHLNISVQHENQKRWKEKQVLWEREREYTCRIIIEWKLHTVNPFRRLCSSLTSVPIILCGSVPTLPGGSWLGVSGSLPSLVNEGVEGSGAAFSFLQTQTVSHQINLPAGPETKPRTQKLQHCL